MTSRNIWLSLVVGSILVCGSLGGLIHVAQQDIATARVGLQTLQDQINVARSTERKSGG